MITFKNNNVEKVQDRENLYFGFICDSRMDYFADIFDSLHHKNGSKDKIVYGFNDRRGGCVCELLMVWYSVDGEIVPRLEVFSDYFDEITKDWHNEILRQVKLLGKVAFTPDEFTRILIKLGFEDNSDIKLDVKKA